MASSARVTSIIDFIRIKVLDKLASKKSTSIYQSSHSFILSLYFNFGTSLFFFISCCLFYNVFTTDIILCSNSLGEGAGFSDKPKIPFLYINYCLSYPQLLSKERKFALFYKWVPWITSSYCFLLYTPKILINKFSCNFIALTLMKINDISNDYYFYEDDAKKKNNNHNNNNNNNSNIFVADNYRIKKITSLLNDLINIRWNKCKIIYFKCLFVHIYALVLNLFLIFLLNFLLQDRFSLYIVDAFPFYRDVQNFSDTMSQTFYPFSECIIPEHRIIYGRELLLICHLTLMEYYEKVFFIIWLYLFILPFFTFVYTLYLFLLFRNNFNSFFEHLLKMHLNYDLFMMSKKLLIKETKLV